MLIINNTINMSTTNWKKINIWLGNKHPIYLNDSNQDIISETYNKLENFIKFHKFAINNKKKFKKEFILYIYNNTIH